MKSKRSQLSRLSFRSKWVTKIVTPVVLFLCFFSSIPNFATGSTSKLATDSRSSLTLEWKEDPLGENSEGTGIALNNWSRGFQKIAKSAKSDSEEIVAIYLWQEGVLDHWFFPQVTPVDDGNEFEVDKHEIYESLFEVLGDPDLENIFDPEVIGATEVKAYFVHTHPREIIEDKVALPKAFKFSDPKVLSLPPSLADIGSLELIKKNILFALQRFSVNLVKDVLEVKSVVVDPVWTYCLSELSDEKLRKSFLNWEKNDLVDRALKKQIFQRGRGIVDLWKGSGARESAGQLPHHWNFPVGGEENFEELVKAKKAWMYRLATSRESKESAGELIGSVEFSGLRKAIYKIEPLSLNGNFTENFQPTTCEF